MLFCFILQSKTLFIWHICHSLLIALSYKFPWALLTFDWLKLASPSFCTYVVVDSSSFDFVTTLGFCDTTEFDTTSVAFLWVLLVPSEKMILEICFKAIFGELKKVCWCLDRFCLSLFVSDMSLATFGTHPQTTR